MKGSLLVALAQFVTEKNGADTWQALLVDAGLPANKRFTPLDTVEDELYFKLVQAAGRTLRLTPTQVWEELADYWINKHTKINMPYYYQGPKSAREFLLGMNDVHSAVGRATSQTARPPEFEFANLADKEVLVTYKSARNMGPYFVSLIKAVAKAYDEPITIRQVTDNQVRVVFAN